ncbi:MAG: hypothetical protein NZ874_03835 [Fimbriimonadales bacterium]|nr:hypothetical protein [Fimbriimonadales bacterium]
MARAACNPAWRGEWERLLAQVRRGVPRGLPVYVLADRGLWAVWLFATVRRYGWHPLLRVNPQGQFRARWQRQARPLTDFSPAQGTQVAVEGAALAYGLRWTVVVFWGASAKEPWYLWTDLPASGVVGAWYGLRGWIEQGFGQLKCGSWGWHRARGWRVGGCLGVGWCVLGRWVVVLGFGVGGWVRWRVWGMLVGVVGVVGGGCLGCWSGMWGRFWG